MSDPVTIPDGYINSFDFDGVITVGLIPRPNDIVVTGRGEDERAVLQQVWTKYGIPPVYIYFNPKTKTMGRTRVDSGQHKAKILLKLIKEGAKIWHHFDDDPIQLKEIQNAILDRIEELTKVKDKTEDQLAEIERLGNFEIVFIGSNRQEK